MWRYFDERCINNGHYLRDLDCNCNDKTGTIMTKKELDELRTAHHKITDYEERILRLRSRMESVTQSLSNTPVQSSRQDTLLNQLAILEEMENALEEKHLDLYRLQKRALEEFELLSYPLGIIMKLRYIDGLSWEAVALESHYSESHCYKLHETYVYDSE